MKRANREKKYVKKSHNRFEKCEKKKSNCMSIAKVSIQSESLQKEASHRGVESFRFIYI